MKKLENELKKNLKLSLDNKYKFEIQPQLLILVGNLIFVYILVFAES